MFSHCLHIFSRTKHTYTPVVYCSCTESCSLFVEIATITIITFPLPSKNQKKNCKLSACCYCNNNYLLKRLTIPIQIELNFSLLLRIHFFYRKRKRDYVMHGKIWTNVFVSKNYIFIQYINGYRKEAKKRLAHRQRQPIFVRPEIDYAITKSFTFIVTIKPFSVV